MSRDTLPDLRRTQEIFWDLIVAPEGVGPAVAELEARGAAGSQAVDRLFAGDERLSAVQRLDIYANMYFYRLLDCLAEDFPKVLAAVGRVHFHNLATDYLLRHPSEHPSLRHLGRRLPGFVAAHPLGATFPWLADLARLDWTRADLFDAADAVPLSRDALARLPQDEAGEAQFTLIPAFALLRFDHEVVSFWRRLDDAAAGGREDEAPHGRATANAAPAAQDDTAAGARDGDGPALVPPPARRRATARVWRKDQIVYHASSDEDEAACLELVRAGESIARICQILAAGRSVTRATERAGRMIQSWIDDGLIAGVTLPGGRA